METAVGLETAGQTPVWRFLLTRRWLGWHLLMVVVSIGMLWLGDWQFHRAMTGNSLSWAYTFEWPLFSGFAVVFWAKTIRDEFKIQRGEMPRVQYAASAEPDLPAGIPAPPRQGAEQAADDDPELAAYNAYLQRLNSEVKSHGKWRGLR